MTVTLQRNEARALKRQLLNHPVAPRGALAPIINVGTTSMLEVLERQYFEQELAEGISCFKYLEGGYGSGKTQFINCLTELAHQHNVVTSVVSIGEECPFSSPLAIFRNIIASFMPPSEDPLTQSAQGLEMLFGTWIAAQLRKMGVAPGTSVPEAVRQQIERPFRGVWLGAPDSQMASALMALGLRLTAAECGSDLSVGDQELISWIRGDKIASKHLKQQFALYEATNDTTAFQRLKTVIAFCRERLGYKGFFVAFDEGGRTVSFRRGSVKQRQAIENMLTMINQNAEGEFGGVMFMYAATPDFRQVIQSSYIALNDRIGSIAFSPGRPMTPLIKLDDVNSDVTLKLLGSRIQDVFAVSDGVLWDNDLQDRNMLALVEALNQRLGYLSNNLPPRYFVYYWCRFLEEQKSSQVELDLPAALEFVEGNKMPDADGL